MNLDVQFYLKLVMRRLPVMLLILLLATAAGVITAIKLPGIYVTEARLLVESPRIPDRLAASTVQTNTGEQLEILRERLLTRETLIDIANDLTVFPDIRDMSPTSVVDKMRAATDILARGGRNSATIISVEFESEDPEIAAAVVNEYVTRLLDENVRMRTGLAGNTLEFFELEVERLSSELSASSAEILAFKSENADALPDGQDYRLNRQSNLEERQARLERELEGIREQRARVVEIFERTGRVASGGPLTASEKRLEELERELLNAKVVFSPENPRIQLLETRIQVLREEVAREQGPGTDLRSAQETMFDISMAEFDGRAETIAEDLTRIRAELAGLEDAIGRTPQVQIRLDALEREYGNISDQYDNAVRRLAAAETGERIELGGEGQRISLVEDATVPTAPTRPNRPVIAASGFVIGLAGAAGLFILLEVLNTSIRRPTELVSSLGITPIATIPFIDTRASRIRRFMRRAAGVTAVFIGLPTVLWSINTFYMPLGSLVDWVFVQLGLI